MTTKTAYIVADADAIPIHLRGRSPYRLSNVAALFREPRSKCLGPDGRLLMASAIEFQTQITPGQLADVCDPVETYEPGRSPQTTRFRCVCDPEIQRGEKEAKGGRRQQILVEKNVEGMMEAIQKNEFECPPLMWNLRADEVVWVYVEDERELRIYEGVATRPDTNHRHHAIIRKENDYRKWVQETGDPEWDSYNPERPYQLSIYTDTFEGEAHKFFVLNTLGTKVSANKAHYVESQTSNPHTHTRLAKDLMDSCGVLTRQNVEIVQSTLSKNSAKMVGIYTLVRGLEAGFPAPPADDAKRAELVTYLAEFIAELSKARPSEIALLSLDKRQEARANTIADQAIMWIAYLRLAAMLRGNPKWRDGVAALGQTYTHRADGKVIWTGDLMDRANPLWTEMGLLVPAPQNPGSFRVVSNRNAQAQAYEALRTVTQAAMSEQQEAAAA